jgi:ankyrin repeat protein
MALRGGVRALFRAAREGDADEVARRLDLQPDLLKAQKPGYDQCPLLYEAATNGRAGVVRLLLEKGADVNKRRQCGWAPIDAAAWHGHEDVVALLLGAGASQRRSFSKDTTLMLASSEGRLGVVRLLLKHMREKGLDEKDHCGLTALYYAFNHKHAEVVRVLLLAGADYAMADKYTGRTARQTALQSRFHPCRAVFEVGALTVMPRCAKYTDHNQDRP